jgi:succinylglutamic semialdehyde dehydrogenase
MAMDGHFIDGAWVSGAGRVFSAQDPATGEIIWTGAEAGADEVALAAETAQAASESWSALPLADRASYLQEFAQQVRQRRDELQEAICQSTGKPRWESATEVDAVIGKVALTIESHEQRRAERVRDAGGVAGATRYKPHGTVAVFGPFNFPAHLPNGHILPALLAGNAVIFKPSEQTPLVGEIYARLWEASGLPPGVFNLLQGARGTGALLSRHPGIDGIFFTGSLTVGLALRRELVETPGKILALEMGGNNPLVVHGVGDLKAAAYGAIQSAFITAGQRCSCARRLILVDGEEARSFLDALIEMSRSISVGRYTEDPEPFMGPVISESAAVNLQRAQASLIERGSKPLLELKATSSRSNFLSPGICDVTGIDSSDSEYFGPLLQVIRVGSFEQAIAEANRTRYGLCAAMFSDDAALFETFFRKIRAGVVNFNRPTTGATGHLPFGGVGDSGNHRPSGYFAPDYCSYPVASMHAARIALPSKLTPGIRTGA